MKFLCIECDEQMVFNGAESSEDNSVGIKFICNGCSREIAMFANPMEAQLVKSLGVQVGGRDTLPRPMEMIANSLSNATSGNEEEALIWESEAEERLQNVPGMARPMAKAAIERYARQNGLGSISVAVMDEARSRL